MICNTHYGYCGGKIKSLEGNFTYTGNYNIRDDGVVELLTSGTITFVGSPTIDVFLVGGGGGGGTGFVESQNGSGSGGGGGYTATYRSVRIGSAQVVIGAGGQGWAQKNYSITQRPTDGGSTSFGPYSVNGGKMGNYISPYTGGDGGSGGGGAGNYSTRGGGNGGSDGGNGVTAGQAGGSGQGSTTREFGESSGKLYAGGGAAGSNGTSLTAAFNEQKGGDGGGADGCGYGSSYKERTNAAANTGGGGGGTGGNWGTSYEASGGNGGSGIVCIRLSA